MGGTSADRITAPIDGDVLGAAGGSESHTLLTTELAAHTHGAGTYEIQTGGDAAQASDNGAVFRDGPLQNSTAVSGDSGSTGGGQAHNNLQPLLILNYIIKT